MRNTLRNIARKLGVGESRSKYHQGNCRGSKLKLRMRMGELHAQRERTLDMNAETVSFIICLVYRIDDHIDQGGYHDSCWQLQ